MDSGEVFSSKFFAVIPARYASSRFPGKPLAEIGGKPMVVQVAERARESGAMRVWVATDDERIASAVRAYGFEPVMTRADHASGTDRVAEVAKQMGLAEDAIVVNVQGDEPLIAPALIRAVAGLLEQDSGAAISTACHPISDAVDLFNPNVVKVVLDSRNRARYFSRAPIPWAREAFAGTVNALPGGLPCLRHIGIYAYRGSFLGRYSSLAPAPLERFEALEQLRALWHGFEIAVALRADASAPGVDTHEDLEHVRAMFDRSVAKG